MLNSHRAVGVGFDHPLSPSLIVLAVEHQPAFFARGRWNTVFVPGDVITALIERRQAIECFELKSLLDCQTDENAPSVFVDEIPPWRIVSEISHAARFRW